MVKEAQFDILIVAHGGLAEQLLATVSHVIGSQGGIFTYGIYDDKARDLQEAEISAKVREICQSRDVIIVTDMFGGSPSNIANNALAMGGCKHGRVLYGINMPALLKLVRSRHKSVSEALHLAVNAGHRYLNACIAQPSANCAVLEEKNED